jgi:hypothetical protein
MMNFVSSLYFYYINTTHAQLHLFLSNDGWRYCSKRDEEGGSLPRVYSAAGSDFLLVSPLLQKQQYRHTINSSSTHTHKILFFFLVLGWMCSSILYHHMYVEGFFDAFCWWQDTFHVLLFNSTQLSPVFFFLVGWPGFLSPPVCDIHWKFVMPFPRLFV